MFLIFFNSVSSSDLLNADHTNADRFSHDSPVTKPVPTSTHIPVTHTDTTCPIFTPTINLDFMTDSDNDSEYDPFASESFPYYIIQKLVCWVLFFMLIRIFTITNYFVNVTFTFIHSISIRRGLLFRSRRERRTIHNS